jgi:hypothetical protein
VRRVRRDNPGKRETQGKAARPGKLVIRASGAAQVTKAIEGKLDKPEIKAALEIRAAREIKATRVIRVVLAIRAALGHVRQANIAIRTPMAM